MGKRNRIRKSISRSSRAAVAWDLNSPRALLSAVAANLTAEHEFNGSRQHLRTGGWATTLESMVLEGDILKPLDEHLAQTRMPTLFDPIQLGAIAAPNRIFMAPMTRGRSTREHVPTPIMADYYRQRAGAGLIITEATGISAQGLGFPYAAGLWNAQQIEAWKLVTSAVHDAGGRIMVQLWHMGRLTHSSYPGRRQPVSASATTAPDMAHTYEGKQPHEEARALSLEEIASVVDDYRQAARNAIIAGFDGVQVHGANGFLIDQFLRSSSNFRHDRYGGSFENRVRLLSEVTTAVAEVVRS